MIMLRYICRSNAYLIGRCFRMRDVGWDHEWSHVGMSSGEGRHQAMDSEEGNGRYVLIQTDIVDLSLRCGQSPRETEKGSSKENRHDVLASRL